MPGSAVLWRSGPGTIVQRGVQKASKRITGIAIAIAMYWNETNTLQAMTAHNAFHVASPTKALFTDKTVCQAQGKQVCHKSSGAAALSGSHGGLAPRVALALLDCAVVAASLAITLTKRAPVSIRGPLFCALVIPRPHKERSSTLQPARLHHPPPADNDCLPRFKAHPPHTQPPCLPTQLPMLRRSP